MKTLIVLLTFLTCLNAGAQTIRLQKSDDGSLVYFLVSSEANIRNYVVEGVNDSINFEVIGAVASQGNTVQPRTYVFDVTGNEFKNYRVKQMDYSGSCVASQCLFAPKKSSAAPAVIKLKEISSMW